MKNKDKLKTVSKDNLDRFYKAKYEYYRDLQIDVVKYTVIGSAVFFLLDCIMNGEAVVESIIPRCLMLIFLFPYLHMVKNHNYKTNLILSYLIMYGIGACSIWAVSNLNDRLYLSDAFIMLQLVFMSIGFSAPKSWSQMWHLGLIVEVMLSSLLIKEMNLLLICIIQLMAYFGTEYIVAIIESKFLDTYESTEEIEGKLVHDQLTKAFNRHKLDDMCIGGSCELDIKRASFLMIDIDFFKKINDTYGHETGDIVLQNLVKIIKSCTRKSDYIIRWGGEEFIIILPDCGEIKAKDIGEQIRVKVMDAKENMCNATVSIGITIYVGGDYHDAIKKADEALYYAKEHGRNQVILNSDLKK